jgi:hypothetical protein
MIGRPCLPDSEAVPAINGCALTTKLAIFGIFRLSSNFKVSLKSSYRPLTFLIADK